MSKVSVIGFYHKRSIENWNILNGTAYPYANIYLDNWDGVVQGKAHGSSWTIRLQKDVVESMEDEYLKALVIHETAHLITYKEHGLSVREHGPEFKNIERTLKEALEDMYPDAQDV